MPELQDDKHDEQKYVQRKKLTWEEIGEVMKRGWWNKATKKYQKKNPDKVKENTRKQNLKKNLRRQKEHRIKIISKKRFWVAPVKALKT
jgi:hypothetical protein